MNHALSLTLICVVVVFTILTVLSVVYTLLGYFYTGQMKKVARATTKVVKTKPKTVKNEPDDDENVAAAVALALHLYEMENLHDEVPMAITINGGESRWRWN